MHYERVVDEGNVLRKVGEGNVRYSRKVDEGNVQTAISQSACANETHQSFNHCDRLHQVRFQTHQSSTVTGHIR